MYKGPYIFLVLFSPLSWALVLFSPRVGHLTIVTNWSLLLSAQLVLHLGADICQFRTASITCAKLMYYAAGMGSFQFWL